MLVRLALDFAIGYLQIYCPSFLVWLDDSIYL